MHIVIETVGALFTLALVQGGVDRMIGNNWKKREKIENHSRMSDPKYTPRITRNTSRGEESKKNKYYSTTRWESLQSRIFKLFNCAGITQSNFP